MTQEELLKSVAEAVMKAHEEGAAKGLGKVTEAVQKVLEARFGTINAPKWLEGIGKQLLEQPEFKGLAQQVAIKGGRVNAGPFTVSLPRYGLKEGEYAAPFTKDLVVSGDFPSERSYLPFFRAPSRRLYLRDVIPVQGLGTPQLEYARITGWTNAAAGVVEADSAAEDDSTGAKPESALTAETKLESAKQIATWIPISRRALRDVGGLAGYINQILGMFLAFEEDAQVLNGTGGANMSGILQDGDVQTQAFSTDILESIRKGMTKLELAMGSGTDVVGFEASAVVIHPTDWETAELTKDLDDRYILLPNGSPAEGRAPASVWRVPVVISPAISQGTALMGAFDIAATLWTYEDVQIRLSDSHLNFFVKNLVAVLAEMRELLAIYYPKAFVAVDVTA